MILYHQTFSPSTCECVIEQQFEHDEVTGLNGQPTLWFFHNVCIKHEPLVKDKPKLSIKDWNKKRDDIFKHHEFLLTKNRERHLKDFDSHPSRKAKQQAIKDMKSSFSGERHALRMESEFDNERTQQEAFLDRHESDSMDKVLIGIHSKYAFIAQDVYDKIMQEGNEV